MRSLFAAIVVCSVISCREGAKTLFTQIDPDHSGVLFSNNIQEDDTSNIIDYYYVYNGGGVAIGDINNDELPDLFFTGNQVPNKLYLNKGNFVFEDITEKAHVGKRAWSAGVVMADVNSDGMLDIYVCNTGNHSSDKRANFLYINKGDLTFEDQAPAFGLADTSYTNQAAFLDYDKDGDLDAYLLTSTNAIRNPNKFVKVKDDGSGYSVDKLLRNDAGKFVDVSAAAGILHDGFGLGIGICDMNADSWPDIFVINDFIANDHLFINNQDGTFTESAKEYFRHHSHFSMGNDIGDFNNDGLNDVMVVDMLPVDPVKQKKMAGPVNPNAFEGMIRAGYHPQHMRNMLFMNLGTGPKSRPVFAEIGQQMGVHSTNWSWAPLWMDVDLDGWQDLFISNGYLRDVTDMDFITHNNNIATSGNVAATNTAMRDGARKMPSIVGTNFLFRNIDGKRFEDMSVSWLGSKPSLSNGASYADLDNDGDLDIVVNNVNESAFILKNNTEGAAFIKVSLKGTSPNTMGLGSTVKVYVDSMTQMRTLNVVRGYQSSVDYALTFGLGNRQRVDSIVVQWPDGSIEVKKDPAINRTHLINQKDSHFRRPEPGMQSRMMLRESSKLIGLAHQHREAFYMDYDVEPLLPRKLSSQGPALASADINGDGLDDVFVGGSYGQTGMLFIQDRSGRFDSMAVDPGKKKYEEDVDAVFIDADNDGDNDLYVVSGSNEYEDNSPYYQDRLLINLGHGRLVKDSSRLPAMHHSGACIAAVDFDKDGDVDLFRGGGLTPLAYSKPGTSYLLSNESGIFTDVTDEVAPGMAGIGMVTDACWSDIDGDGWHDLIIVGEYMPVSIFRNEKGKLKQIRPASLEYSNGFWNCITPVDIDRDGDIDFIAGNQGTNTRYHCSKDAPLSVYGGDFDMNGRWDAIPAFYHNKQEFPIPSLPDLQRQVPLFKKRYQNYDLYARTTMQELIAPVKDRLVQVAKVFEQRSMIIENLGDGKFRLTALPDDAQRSPITCIVNTDVDNDGYADLLLVGNDYEIEPAEGRRDAGVGVLITGDQQKKLTVVPPAQSGFWVEGAGKKITMIKSAGRTVILVAQNNGPMLAFIGQTEEIRK